MRGELLRERVGGGKWDDSRVGLHAVGLSIRRGRV